MYVSVFVYVHILGYTDKIYYIKILPVNTNFLLLDICIGIFVDVTDPSNEMLRGQS